MTGSVIPLRDVGGGRSKTRESTGPRTGRVARITEASQAFQHTSLGKAQDARSGVGERICCFAAASVYGSMQRELLRRPSAPTLHSVRTSTGGTTWTLDLIHRVDNPRGGEPRTKSISPSRCFRETLSSHRAPSGMAHDPHNGDSEKTRASHGGHDTLSVLMLACRRADTRLH